MSEKSAAFAVSLFQKGAIVNIREFVAPQLASRFVLVWPIAVANTSRMFELLNLLG